MGKQIFKLKRSAKAKNKAYSPRLKPIAALVFAGMFACAPVSAQQKGSIEGKIRGNETGLGGVTVTATSDVMPKPRSSVTKDDGSYNLPFLIAGTYELTFTSPDGGEKTVTVEVLLDQASKINLTLPQQEGNVMTIVGSSVVVLRDGNSSLSNSISSKDIESLPIGQDYRDLFKLVPGVQYSEDSVLGPSAGGSGRDNKYGFDGVDVSLPMFGNLASEPSTHDIESVSLDRGGAKAIGFNRSGGFAIDTVSKSGTNEFHGHLEYKTQPKSFVANKDDEANTKFEEDKNWISLGVSGPIIEDELFFYASYYRPEVTRVNKENLRGPVKNFKSVREEFFGKLTYAPTEDLLFNISYRTSDRNGEGEGVGSQDADSTSEGSDAFQDIFTLEGSYIVSDYTTVSFAYSTFDLKTRAAPDNILSDVQPVLGAALDLNRLEQLGAFNVPDLDSGNPLFDNAGAQALIDRFGYIDANGVLAGGGQIGAASTINNQDFFRDSFEAALDHEMDIGDTVHRMHVGFQWKDGTEVLDRVSNGWGSISYVGGADTDDPARYYRARVQQMSLVGADGASVAGITSRTESFNLEFNDTIEDGDFTYNVGFLISHDVLYGQGLSKNSNNVSGFELAPGEEYKMYSVPWKDMFQPRLGVTWQYAERDTLFANFSQYNPEASSLARAASWARNTRRTLDLYFDSNGDFLDFDPARGSSGKFFVENMKPRRIDELTIGATKAVSDKLYLRAHVRRREGSHFWEDVSNSARSNVYPSPFGGVPPEVAARGDFIPNLQSFRDEVGGSSFVIADIDTAYTSYNEISMEAEWTGDRTYLNASYVWSNYYGNFDQDAISGNPDRNLFIGSSLLADGPGRFPWDGKNGKLLGNKPHVFKAYGYYTTDWNANVGAYFVYQSGNVWEPWDGSVFDQRFSTIRNREPAGSRRTEGHHQLDLNYTQDFEFGEDYVLQFRADLFNVYNNQSVTRVNQFFTSSTFGEPTRQINPRRLQLSFNFVF